MLDDFSFPVALTGNKTQVIFLTSLASVALASQSCRNCTDAAVHALAHGEIPGSQPGSQNPHSCLHGLGPSTAPRGDRRPTEMLQLTQVDGRAAVTPRGRFPKELREELGSAFVQVPETLRAWCDTGRAGAGWEVTPPPCQLQQSHLYPKYTCTCHTMRFKQELCHRLRVAMDLTLNLS